MSVDREPSRTGITLTALASLLAASGSLMGGSPAALLGLPLALVGVYRTHRGLLAAGVALQWVGVLLAGLGGGLPVFVLLGMVGAVLTWDVGENAISMAGHVRTGASEHAEIVHAATVAVVTLSVTCVGYAVYALASGGQPGVALSLLVFGTVVVVLVFGK